MDFALNEEEQAIADLTAQVLGDRSTHERLRDLAATEDHVDRDTWSILAETGVVGASLPEDHGGLGLGFLATCAALEQVGAHASPVPLLSSVVNAALPLAEFGTADQKAAWLPGLADGSTLGCAALAEEDSPPAQPETQARADGDGYSLTGTKVLVAGGLEADVALVPARLPDEQLTVFIIPTSAPELDVQRVDVTTGRPEARFELAGVSVDADALLGGGGADGTEIVRFIEQRANVGMCMLMAGSARSSIGLAADYTKERHQFDRPIATFQAVSNRAGDSYIDTQAIVLSAYQAAWRLSAGLPADHEIAIAKYWAAEAGFRVVHAAVHVHGGVGVDRDYPLHRHFLLARQLELTLGHAEEQLTTLGRLIAAG